MAEREINPGLLYRAINERDAVEASGRKPICGPCYREQFPGRKPVRVLPMRAEVCYVCDQLTTMGIYVRVTP